MISGLLNILGFSHIWSYVKFSPAVSIFLDLTIPHTCKLAECMVTELPGARNNCLADTWQIFCQTPILTDIPRNPKSLHFKWVGVTPIVIPKPFWQKRPAGLPGTQLLNFIDDFRLAAPRKCKRPPLGGLALLPAGGPCPPGGLTTTCLPRHNRRR